MRSDALVMLVTLPVETDVDHHVAELRRGVEDSSAAHREQCHAPPPFKNTGNFEPPDNHTTTVTTAGFSVGTGLVREVQRYIDISTESRFMQGIEGRKGPAFAWWILYPRPPNQPRLHTLR